MLKPLKIHRKRKKPRLNKSTKNPQNNIVLSHFKIPSIELPEELIFSEILTRLPVPSITRFKTVSKRWKLLISTQHFIKSHIERTKTNPFVPTNCVFIKSDYYFYILNYSAYDKTPDDQFGEKGLTLVKSRNFYNGVDTFLIGSFNGLICFGRGCGFSGFDYYFYVCNPLMGEFVHVFDPLGNFQGNLIYGFGYVCCKNDYLLFVGGLQRRSNDNFVYVYSLRSNVWKKIGVFDEFGFSIILGGTGVLVNETLHWGASQIRASNSGCIHGFDLVDECFKDVRLPRLFLGGNDHVLCSKVCELDGCLCVWAEDLYGGVEMWSLRQYGVWDSWTKLFKIDMVYAVGNFYGRLENGKVLVQTKDGSLLLVDPEQNPPKFTSLVTDLGDVEVVSYIRSPVSPFLHSNVAEIEGQAQVSNE